MGETRPLVFTTRKRIMGPLTRKSDNHHRRCRIISSFGGPRRSGKSRNPAIADLLYNIKTAFARIRLDGLLKFDALLNRMGFLYLRAFLNLRDLRWVDVEIIGKLPY